MVSRCSPNDSTDPCSAVLPYCNNDNSGRTSNRFGKKSNRTRSTKYFRPLQQLYKTVQSPLYGKNSSSINFACVYRPSDRYKTTNMTYGSFHYNNWSFVQKNRPVKYNSELFARCYNNNKQQKMIDQSNFKGYLTDASNSNENQPISDGCCPINCCNDTISNVLNC